MTNSYIGITSYIYGVWILSPGSTKNASVQTEEMGGEKPASFGAWGPAAGPGWGSPGAFPGMVAESGREARPSGAAS